MGEKVGSQRPIGSSRQVRWAANIWSSQSSFAGLELATKQIDANALQDCPPIGQSAKGELIFGMDCKALKPENRVRPISNCTKVRIAAPWASGASAVSGDNYLLEP